MERVGKGKKMAQLWDGEGGPLVLLQPRQWQNDNAALSFAPALSSLAACL